MCVSYKGKTAVAACQGDVADLGEKLETLVAHRDRASKTWRGLRQKRGGCCICLIEEIIIYIRRRRRKKKMKIKKAISSVALLAEKFSSRCTSSSKNRVACKGRIKKKKRICLRQMIINTKKSLTAGLIIQCIFYDNSTIPRYICSHSLKFLRAVIRGRS